MLTIKSQLYILVRIKRRYLLINGDKTMTTIANTILSHCGGGNKIAAMTGCEIAAHKNSVTLAFSTLAGGDGKKISHLEIVYNKATDLYDITAYKFNKRAFNIKTILSVQDVFAGDLQKTCENICQLNFTL